MQKGAEISSEQSVQEIVSETHNYEEVTNKTTAEEPKTTINNTQQTNITQQTNKTTNIEQKEIPIIASDMPLINKKCRNSTILYGGCKWNDDNQTTFDLKIKNDGRTDIPGAWMIITGESGGVRNIKRTEMITIGAIRTYNIDYVSLVKEIGKVTRLEFYPVEVINNTEYACLNMRVYTIPETYCKLSKPISMG
jgi:hypothetical protein